MVEDQYKIIEGKKGAITKILDTKRNAYNALVLAAKMAK